MKEQSVSHIFTNVTIHVFYAEPAFLIPNLFVRQRNEISDESIISQINALCYSAVTFVEHSIG